VLEHSLKNTGRRAVQTSVYNHNFLVLDGQAPGPGFVITVPFQIQTPRPPAKELAEIRGNQIVYLKTLQNRDIVTTPLRGFISDSPKDNDIRVENGRLGVGMRITADRPLSSESLWSIRSVLAMEPFVSMSIEPGNEFTWKSTYNYYTLPANATDHEIQKWVARQHRFVPEGAWMTRCKVEFGLAAPGDAAQENPCPPDKVAAIKAFRHFGLL
jgi:hypothetical protein